MKNTIERNTAWYDTIINFFISDSEIEDKDDNSDRGYQEWKKANADSIDENAIKNLEEMVNYKAARKRGTANNVRVESENNVMQTPEIESTNHHSKNTLDDELVK